MKNFLIFLAGVVTGAALLFLVALAITSSSEGDIDGLTLFEAPSEVVENTSYKVFQVIEGGNALAFAGTEILSDTYVYVGKVVLFLADDNTHYYDDQVIDVPKGKCTRQVGIYKYDTEDGYKTVPVVAICDK